MTDPRLRTIRTLLCLGLSCLFFGVGWLWAGLGFTALGLFMPVFATASVCPTQCTTVPSSVSLTAGNITNGTCSSCADYNITTVLSGFADVASSCYSQEPMGVTSCATGAIMECRFAVVSGNVRISPARIFIGNNPFDACSANFVSANLGADPIDCSAVGSPSLTWSSGADNQCTMNASTLAIVVTP